MKRILAILLICASSFCASAQNHGKLPVIIEIAQVESGDGELILDVFSIERDGDIKYYLNVGSLGIGDEVIQINFDPLFKLFIPLGETQDEVMETLGSLQELYNETPGTSIECAGNFAPALPDDKLETVKVTLRKVLLSRKLEFALEREGYTRATYVSKSDFKNLMVNVKLNRKLFSKH